MTKLTKIQQQQLNELKRNGSLYVSYNSPAMMKVFEKLVEKGLATATRLESGKRYQVKK